MANIMTKRGIKDNVVTYEHYCDNIADLQNIPQEQINLGSVAIIVNGESGGIEVYIANSQKEWSMITTMNNGSGESSVDPEVIIQAVNDYLDDHPELTTTVQDGSITKAKLNNEVLSSIEIIQNSISYTDVPTAATSYPFNFIAGHKYRLTVVGTGVTAFYRFFTTTNGLVTGEVDNFGSFKEGEKTVELEATADATYIRKGSYPAGTVSFTLTDLSLINGRLTKAEEDIAELKTDTTGMHEEITEITDEITNLKNSRSTWGTISKEDCVYIGQYYFNTTGTITANVSYRAWVFEAETDGKIYIEPKGIDTIHIARYSAATYTEDSFTGTIIERITDPIDEESAVSFHAGEIIGIDFSKNNLNKTIHVYSEYLNSERIKNIEEELAKIEILKKSRNYIHLAESYPIYVGDTLEIFYKGIFALFNPYKYAVRITCDVGHAYEKKYLFTPTNEHAGNNYPITVALYNDEGKQIESAESEIVVIEPQNPATKKNILVIGDSMTAGGQWVTEVKSMMDDMNLTNYDFIGQFGSAPGAKYQAIGGYNYTRYNNEYLTQNWVWITATHDKTNDDVGTVYKDANNEAWRIVRVTANQLQLWANNGSTVQQPIPTNGTLTYLQGGGSNAHKTDITYTAATTQASGNPFWNKDENKVDIQWYVETVCGASGIDYAVIFLGWNDEYKDLDHEAWFKERVNTMIANIRTDYPNCVILLAGVQMPSANGMGKNYGTSPSYSAWIDWVFLGHHKWLKEIAEEIGNAYFVDISAQFDTEHGYNTENVPVNKRSNETESYQSDPVHPATSGYLQFGDAIFRKLLEIAAN